YRSSACVKRADVSVIPVEGTGSPLTLAHPPLSVQGTAGQLCNHRLPPLESPGMPLGRYVLTAHFVLEATADGLCDAHSAADFSPSSVIPADWVRKRDPFQTAYKRAFGFSVTLTATAPSATRGPSAGVDRSPPPTQREQIAANEEPAS